MKHILQTKILTYLWDTLDNLSFKLISYCSYKHSANITETLENVVIHKNSYSPII